MGAGIQIFNECLKKFKPKEFADVKLMSPINCTSPCLLLAKKTINTIDDFKV